MAHFSASSLAKPTHFNFATDVVDYWAAKSPPLQAMYWVSQDTSVIRQLDYSHFQRRSHRISVLLRDLDVKPGEVMLMIIPRVPEW
jgi:medium-chain acyl-CoA synthetase